MTDEVNVEKSTGSTKGCESLFKKAWENGLGAWAVAEQITASFCNLNTFESAAIIIRMGIMAKDVKLREEFSDSDARKSIWEKVLEDVNSVCALQPADVDAFIFGLKGDPNIQLSIQNLKNIWTPLDPEENLNIEWLLEMGVPYEKEVPPLPYDEADKKLALKKWREPENKAALLAIRGYKKEQFDPRDWADIATLIRLMVMEATTANEAGADAAAVIKLSKSIDEKKSNLGLRQKISTKARDFESEFTALIKKATKYRKENPEDFTWLCPECGSPNMLWFPHWAFDKNRAVWNDDLIDLMRCVLAHKKMPDKEIIWRFAKVLRISPIGLLAEAEIKNYNIGRKYDVSRPPSLTDLVHTGKVPVDLYDSQKQIEFLYTDRQIMADDSKESTA